MTDKYNIDQYLNAGKRLTPKFGAVPKFKDWVNLEVTPEQIYAHNDNVGWVLDEHDLVIDVDPRNGGTESFERLLKDFEGYNLRDKLTPTVATPRGGFHIYLSIREPRIDKLLRLQIRDYPGIEFFSVGRSVTIPGSVMPDGTHSWHSEGAGKFEQNVVPACLLVLIEYAPGKAKNLKQYDDCTESALMMALCDVDPNMSYDEWLKVLMAVHSWCPQRGQAICEQWSQGSPKYAAGEVADKWCGFNGGGGVTVGTIFFLASESRQHGLGGASESFKVLARAAATAPPSEAVIDSSVDTEIGIVDGLIAEVLAAVDKPALSKLRYKLAEVAFKKKLGADSKEELAQKYKEQYIKITGTKLSIAVVRNMLKHKEADGADHNPRWYEDWCFLDSQERYVNLKTLKILGVLGFNDTVGGYVPENDAGSRPSASKYVASNMLLRHIDKMAYMPTKKETIFTLDGDVCLNTFDPTSLPTTATVITPEGQAAIDRMLKHIEFLCGTPEKASILTQWLAHQVQYPGKKILWAPLIQSEEGMGKSYIGHLIKALMGTKNVKVVPSQRASSDFNGWASGSCVIILNELRIIGQSRHEAANAIKELITDPTAHINTKGVDSYEVPNPASYIVFTNYKDCVPIHDRSRRWWVVFVPVIDPENISASVGLNDPSATVYFTKLFAMIDPDGGTNKVAELRRYLMDYPISGTFMSYKVAPHTNDKASMIALDESKTEALAETRARIQKGSEYYCKAVISSSDLFSDVLSDLEASSGITTLHSSHKNRILSNLGYTPVAGGKQIKIDGQLKQFWSRNTIDRSDIRPLLEDNRVRMVERAARDAERRAVDIQTKSQNAALTFENIDEIQVDSVLQV